MGTEKKILQENLLHRTTCWRQLLLGVIFSTQIGAWFCWKE